MNDNNDGRPILLGATFRNTTTSLSRSEHHSYSQTHPVVADNGEQLQQLERHQAFKWRMDDRDVPLLPEIYTSMSFPLVFRDLSVRVISERLSEFMRMNSIRCEYDNPKACAVCSTSWVTFVVRFWRQPTSHPSSSSESVTVRSRPEIVIEVQRRQGCSIAMHRIRRALASSIQGENARPFMVDMTSSIRRRFRPSPLVKDHFRFSSSKLNRSDSGLCYSKDDLTNTINLLESDSYDEKDLGIESLFILSDSRKVQKEDAIEVARSLIYRSGRHGEPLQNAVEDYLFDLEGRRGSIDKKQYFFALSALANGLALVVDDVDYETRKSRIGEDASGMLTVFWRNVTEVLLRRLGSFEQSPSCAALAAKCIRLLDTLVPKDAEYLCVDVSYLSCLSYAAHEYGKAYNALLEEESSQLCNTVANVNQ